MIDPRLKLLVIDDDELIASSIRLAAPQQWRIEHSPELKVSAASYSAALVDMHLSGDLSRAEGLSVIERLRTGNPHLEIVAMSGDLDRSLMEACLKAGASRFLAKPLTSEELLLTLEKIEALILLRQACVRAVGGHAVPWIGSGAASSEVKRQIAALRGENGPILIEGESGTGKEVAAQLLHTQEGDSRALIAINLAAMPDNIFESEFFGHMRGAFTGADQNKMGLAEAAHGGDLFLDEVEALPLQSQAKLLRFLESGEVRRVGAKESIRVDVRVISATNQSLETMVREGKFREDLLWRLSGKKLPLPSLRNRLEDVTELAEFFISQERPKRNKSLASDAIEALMSHSWPGNVRELKRVCEQLCLHAPLPLLRAEDIRRILPARASTPVAAQGAAIDLTRGLNEILADFEADLIRSALRKNDGDIDRTVMLLKISRSSLYKKMKDYNIETRS